MQEWRERGTYLSARVDPGGSESSQIFLVTLSVAALHLPVEKVPKVGSFWHLRQILALLFRVVGAQRGSNFG